MTVNVVGRDNRRVESDEGVEMRTRVVGAGATGGYVGAQLIAGGRDLTFLVREARRSQLNKHGLQVNTADGALVSTPVRAITREELAEQFDIVVVAVRAAAVDAAIEDLARAVGDSTFIVPLVNGMNHLDALVGRFGRHRVCGAAAKLAVSIRGDVINEVKPGVDLEMGALDTADAEAVAAVARELSVPGIATTVVTDIVSAMWSKFAFITSTTALTCLLRQRIGPIARAPGGIDIAATILSEVSSIADSEGHPLGAPAHEQLRTFLTDPQSPFAPSMFRDLQDQQPVETEVLGELTQRARRHRLEVPLLDAAYLALVVHNNTVAGV
jgi:2-dehydropantoate 2-reductase